MTGPKWRIGDGAHLPSRGVDVTIVWVGICNAIVRCACGAEFDVPLTDLSTGGYL